MSNKVATTNIFSSLQYDSDNEAPVKVTVAQKAKEETKAPQSAQRVNKEQRGGKREQGENREERVTKENHQRPKNLKDGPKTKGVPAEPHPQDRKSGTGISGVDKKKFRKDGGGRHNYGTIKDEVQDIKQQEGKVEAVVEEVQPEEPVVVDNTITVEEYFKSFGVVEEKTEKAPERQLNLDELKREKLQLVVTKSEKVLDQGVIKANQKKNKGLTTYLLGCNTENSDLLGVKTGTTLVKFEVKKEGEEVVGNVAKDNKDIKDRKPKDVREKKTNTHTKTKKVNVDNETDFPKLA